MGSHTTSSHGGLHSGHHTTPSSGGNSLSNGLDTSSNKLLESLSYGAMASQYGCHDDTSSRDTLDPGEKHINNNNNNKYLYSASL